MGICWGGHFESPELFPPEAPQKIGREDQQKTKNAKSLYYQPKQCTILKCSGNSSKLSYSIIFALFNDSSQNGFHLKRPPNKTWSRVTNVGKPSNEKQDNLAPRSGSMFEDLHKREKPVGSMGGLYAYHYLPTSSYFFCMINVGKYTS